MAEHPTLDDVLASAAELQRLVPGAVLVGGTAVAQRVRHRLSTDHDHVLVDLDDRFDTVLEHLEALGDWSTARAQPGRIILGSLGGIESGLRQLRRRRPLETETVSVGDEPLTVPTLPEILRIKAWLLVTRNQTRDHLDLAALADHVGVEQAAAVLSELDEYYDDLNEADVPVATQVVRQLSDPRPRDVEVTRQLSSYRDLAERWQSWDEVCAVLALVAQAMVAPA
jgi:hypothetical protein